MPRLRTFIAVPLATNIRDRLTSLQERLQKVTDQVKWVEAENLHITLNFLGEVPELETVSICRLVERECKSVRGFSLQLSGLDGFPSLRRAKTLWVGVDEGRESLQQLNARLSEALTELGNFPRENREFVPHITLGRLSEEIQADLAAELSKESGFSAGPQNVQEVHVYSSQLTRTGPIYTLMSRARLRGR